MKLSIWLCGSDFPSVVLFYRFSFFLLMCSFSFFLFIIFISLESRKMIVKLLQSEPLRGDFVIAQNYIDSQKSSHTHSHIYVISSPIFSCSVIISSSHNIHLYYMKSFGIERKRRKDDIKKQWIKNEMGKKNACVFILIITYDYVQCPRFPITLKKKMKKQPSNECSTWSIHTF